LSQEAHALFQKLISAIIISAGMLVCASAQDRVVNVYNWSGHIDTKLLEAFTAETGIRVTYDLYDTSEVVEAKLLAGGSGYDVAVPSATSLARLIKAGSLHALDKTRLKNLGNVWPDIAKQLAVHDPGNTFAINYLWGTIGIGINTKKITQRLGEAPLNTWDLIMKPEIANKLKDCGIQIFDSPEDIFPIVLNHLKLSPTSKLEVELRKAADALMRIRGNVQKFQTSDYINALANGEICLAVGYSSDVLQAKRRAEEANNGIEIAYLIPREGTQLWLDSMVIPSDARNKAEAHAFIDFILKAETAAAISIFNSHTTGNSKARQVINPEIMSNRSIYPDDTTFARLFTTPALDEKSRLLVSRLWNRIKTGK
jgi:putrescine transport system substrate-binding protein